MATAQAWEVLTTAPEGTADSRRTPGPGEAPQPSGVRSFRAVLIYILWLGPPTAHSLACVSQIGAVERPCLWQCIHPLFDQHPALQLNLTEAELEWRASLAFVRPILIGTGPLTPVRLFDLSFAQHCPPRLPPTLSRADRLHISSAQAGYAQRSSLRN